MARIQIPLDVLTSRLNLGERFAGLRSGTMSTRFANLRPLTEFFDFKRLSKPEDFGVMQSRVNYNLGHFSSNYSAVFVMLCIYALLTNPALLFTIVFVTVGMWVIGKLDGRDLELGPHRFTTSQLYTGLYVIAIPVGLYSSPWRTVLWLIGASGVLIIGHAAMMDKPIDEAFSGEAAQQPTRAGSDDVFSWWEAGQRVVEEVESEEDSDSEGAGLASATGNGGVNRETGLVRARRTGRSSSDGSGSGEDEGLGQLSLAEREDALYESAMARIRRAQEKGKQEVKLTKDELAAMERRRKREDEKRRRRKEQRVAIPLSQLTSGFGSRRSSVGGDTPPRHSSSDVSDGPSKGYFPPSSSRSRLVAGSGSRTPSRAAADRDLDESPFEYAYVNPDTVVSSRHASDSAPGRPHPKLNTRTDTASPVSRSGSTNGGVDPFQFITGSARPSPHNGSAPSRRPASAASPDVSYIYSDSPTSQRRITPSGSSDSEDDGSPMPPPVRVNSSGSGRVPPAIEDRPRREPERRSTRDRSPVGPPSSSKRPSTTAQAPRRKSILGSSITATKTKKKGK
ncbi:prenylated rab acceptor 1 [Podospora conica]|nr:prenylated rab acceptor 1 [Schizothecium conicum]